MTTTKLTLTLLACLTLGACTELNPTYDPRYNRPDGAVTAPKPDSGLPGTDADPNPQSDTIKTPTGDLAPASKFRSKPTRAYNSPSVGGDSTTCNPKGVLDKYKVDPSNTVTDLDHKPNDLYGLIHIGNSGPPIETTDCVEVDFGQLQKTGRIVVWATGVNKGCDSHCGKDPKDPGAGVQCGKTPHIWIAAGKDSTVWPYRVKLKVFGHDFIGYQLDLKGAAVRYALVCRNAESAYKRDIRVDYIEAFPPTP